MGQERLKGYLAAQNDICLSKFAMNIVIFLKIAG